MTGGIFKYPAGMSENGIYRYRYYYIGTIAVHSLLVPFGSGGWVAAATVVVERGVAGTDGISVSVCTDIMANMGAFAGMGSHNAATSTSTARRSEDLEEYVMYVLCCRTCRTSMCSAVKGEPGGEERDKCVCV